MEKARKERKRGGQDEQICLKIPFDKRGWATVEFITY